MDNFCSGGKSLIPKIISAISVSLNVSEIKRIIVRVLSPITSHRLYNITPLILIERRDEDERRDDIAVWVQGT